MAGNPNFTGPEIPLRSTVPGAAVPEVPAWFYRDLPRGEFVAAAYGWMC